jgi:hypothetical protein
MVQSVQAQSFTHPGILHSQADLDRMKTNVAGNIQPWKSGYTNFAANSFSSSSYVMQGPFSTYGRNPDVNTSQMHGDAAAAYHNAVMWYITGNVAYANKAIQLINGWSSTMTSITGSDASLAASLDGFCWVNAAEILRYSNSGWAATDITRCENWLKNVWYPVLDPFALYANGNWDTACVKTMMGIGVFCNDRPKFERGLQFFLNGAGNGRVSYYIVNTNGQCQESGRDQAHTELGIGHLAEAAWLGWNQGLDLYGWSTNRILQGFEYTASYNLLNSVSWQNWLDRSGKYYNTAIASGDRGTKRPVFEMVWNHYQNRRGIAATFTKQMADSVRPEGATATPTDNPGFGTLLFSLPVAPPPAPTTVPHVPSGLFFYGSGTSTIINWPLVTDATSYNVKRATTSGGPYTTLATGITPTSYSDTTATAGQVYYYVLSASNSFGEGPNSFELAASSSLPSPWLHQDVGTVSVAGAANYDGTFKIEASGSDIGGTADSLHFAYVPMTGNGTVTARVIWPLNSQSAKVGVMMRQTLANNSIHASTLLAPTWSGTWVTRASVGGSTTVSGTTSLPSPYVVNSRLMMPYWFRIARSGNTFTGSMSPDGVTWTQLGSTSITMSNTIYVGLAGCSRLTTLPVTTITAFDKVTAP